LIPEGKESVQYKRRAVLIIGALLSSFLILVLAEIGLRRRENSRISPRVSEGNKTIHQKSEDTTLIYELVPGSEATRRGVRIKINAAGFRDDEFPEHGDYDGRRIVLLGDSIAWGWGVQMAAAFPQLLEIHLHTMTAKDEIPPIIYNLSVDGYSTEQELRMLERRGFEFQPDLVIINYVLNDPDTADGGLARYYRSDIMLIRLARRAAARVDQILFSKQNVTEYHQQIHSDNEKQIRRCFRQLGQLSEENNVPILVAITPVFHFQPGQPYYWQNIHDSIEQLCEQNDLLFVDLTSGFRGKHSTKYSFDKWHPNEAGHSIIAEVLADYLKNY
jgi:lysophospholipase L1-like esterase